MCALIGYFIGKYFGNMILAIGASILVSAIIMGIEIGSQRIPIKAFISGAVGLVIGLIIANLVSSVIYYVQIDSEKWNFIKQLIYPFLNLLFGYLGIVIGVAKKDELFDLPSSFSVRTKSSSPIASESDIYKILDTSVIIDGRVADICETGFIDGIIVIPRFVLKELQHIADSSDSLKRNRGRRGLDILNRIQKQSKTNVIVHEKDYPEIDEVDSKLVKLAKVMNGKVVTNDYNLNKVAELQGVGVLNINELANAVKSVFLPGEEMKMSVIKEGKEMGQGVGYLEDGTMVVVDNGRMYIGEDKIVVVTSVLQTPAGKMIFTKIKGED